MRVCLRARTEAEELNFARMSRGHKGKRSLYGCAVQKLAERLTVQILKKTLR